MVPNLDSGREAAYGRARRRCEYRGRWDAGRCGWPARHRHKTRRSAAWPSVVGMRPLAHSLLEPRRGLLQTSDDAGSAPFCRLAGGRLHAFLRGLGIPLQFRDTFLHGRIWRGKLRRASRNTGSRGQGVSAGQGADPASSARNCNAGGLVEFTFAVGSQVAVGQGRTVTRPTCEHLEEKGPFGDPAGIGPQLQGRFSVVMGH